MDIRVNFQDWNIKQMLAQIDNACIKASSNVLDHHFSINRKKLKEWFVCCVACGYGSVGLTFLSVMQITHRLMISQKTSNVNLSLICAESTSEATLS